MSKRIREESSSSYPYSTLNGGKWLKKALDPADVDVDVVGFPDTETVPRVILNYQMQQDIPIPDMGTYITTTTNAYDAELYLFQNPLIFGVSASFPQSTRDIAGTTIHVNFSSGYFNIDSMCAPRTVSVYMNDQIEGKGIEEKLVNFKKYCQRYRMIYGGVQAIPACSAMFDSGTIEATQQVFSPETINAGGVMLPTGGLDSNVYRLQVFNENDFPTSGVAIQNPTSLYCRYKEGMYMPYKIRNPLVHTFKSAEEKTLVKCPYFVSNQAFWVIDDYETPGQHTNGNFVYNAESHQFQRAQADVYHARSGYTRFYLKCYSKTGIPFWMMLYWKNNVTPSEPADDAATIKLPELIPVYPTASELMHGDNWSLSIIPCVGEIQPVTSTGYDWTIDHVMNLTTSDSTLGAVFFKSIGVQASVRLIFRMGVEFMITAGGVYSPFKHKAPKFDQLAINTYIRTIHGMRDAFYGDAAESGHAEYAAQILDIANGGNQGAGWYGRVSL